MNVAIITARSGVPGHPDKNMFPVNGIPLISYPIQAALRARLVDNVYVSTDARDIAAFGRSLGTHIIERPAELMSPTVDYGDVVRHAVEYLDGTLSALENIALLPGNSVMIDTVTIDQGLKLLDEESHIDSCMSVWRAGHDHPNRAMELNPSGFLQPYAEPGRDVTDEHEAYRPAYFFDQGAWIFRKETVRKREGPSPWWWMGARCAPLERPWIHGRDVHTYFELAIAEWWIRNTAQLQTIFRSDESPIPDKRAE